jgi:hypothetical protein
MAESQTQIGTISITVEEGAIQAIGKDGKTRPLAQGDAVYLHDTIVTEKGSYLKIILNDGTILQLGPNSRASLDKYTYDSQAQSGEFESSVSSGSFRFISGKIAGSHQGQHSLIKTPSAYIGIRGSEIDAQIDDTGSTKVLHLSGLITVMARYQAMGEQVVFESGTLVYIPSVRDQALSINRATEEQIQEANHRWDVFNTLESDNQFAPNAHESRNQSDTESLLEKFLNNHGNVQQEAGARNPFAPVGDSGSNQLVDDLAKSAEEVRNAAIKPYQQGESLATRLLKGEKVEFEDSLKEGTSTSSESDKETIIDKLLDFIEEQADATDEADDSRLPTNRDNTIPSDNGIKPDDNGVNKPDDGGGKKPDDDGKADDGSDDGGNTPPSEPRIIELQLSEDALQHIDASRGAVIARWLPAGHGQVVDNGDGTFSYTPALNFHGTDSFSYTLANGNTVTVNFTILPVNDAPQAVADEVTVIEDTPIIFPSAQLLNNDREIDEGDQLTLVSVTADKDLTQGTVFINQQGNIVYSPPADFFGNTQFSYTIQDSAGERSTATVVVKVEAVNDAPIASSDIVSVENENGLIIPTTTLLSNDSDVDNSNLRIADVMNSRYGQVRLTSQGVEFIPETSFSGGSFDYVVTDGEKTAVGHVDITRQNFPPRVQNDNLVIQQFQPLTINAAQLLSNDVDLENDPLRIVSVTPNMGGQVVIDSVTNAVIFTPTTDLVSNAIGNFSYVVSDSKGNTAEATVTLNWNNQPPLATADEIPLIQLEPLLIAGNQLLANDTDPNNDILQLVNVSGGVNGTASLDSRTQQITFTPDSAAVSSTGMAQFRYEISDGNTHSASAVVTLTYSPPPSQPSPDQPSPTPDLPNQPPVAGNDFLEIGEQASRNINPSELLSNDSDLNGDPLTITGIVSSDKGTATLASDGNITFTRDAAFAGTGGFVYQISDNKGGVATAQVTVSGIMPPPSPNPLQLGNDEKSTFKNQPVVLSFALLLLNDSILNNATVKPNIIEVNNATNGTVELGGADNVIFKPNQDFVGEAGFDYIAVDSDGHRATAHVTIPVKNQPPIATDDNIAGTLIDFSTFVDTPLILTADQLKANDFDLDGDPIPITSAGAVDGGNVSLDLAQQTIQFIPNPGFIGAGHFTYAIADANQELGKATVTVIVEEHFGIPDTRSVQKNTVLTVTTADLLHNDQRLGLAITDVAKATHGTVNFDKTTGKISFTPDANFTGEANFQYQLIDNRGKVDHATVTITVMNTPPIAVPDTTISPLQGTLLLTTAELLANDRDADPQDKLTITKVDKAQNGTVELQGEQIFFTPMPNSSGGSPASFEYTVTDTSGATAQAQVTMTVNTPPLAQPDTVKVNANETLIIKTQDLLQNDSDVNPQDKLQITTVDNAQHGTVIKQGEAILFTPKANFFGEASFDYTITDGHDTAKAQVTIMVNAIPIAQADQATILANQTLTLSANDLLKNDSDSDSLDKLTITTVNNAQNGTVILRGETILFTPTKDFSGEASFDYTVTDNAGATATAQVTITIEPNENIPPLINSPTSSTPLIYNLGAAPIPVLNSATTITDPDSTDFNGGTVQVTVSNRSTADVLQIENRDAITVSNPTGGTIYHNGTSIGTFYTQFTTGTLFINLNEHATPLTTESLLRTISYKYSATTIPTTATRTVQVTLSDGDGGTTQPIGNDIQLTIANNPPLANADDKPLPFNSPVTFHVAELLRNDTDADPTDIINVTNVSNPSEGLEISQTGNEIQLFVNAIVNDQFNDKASFSYTISDGQGGEATATVNLTPNNVTHGSANADNFSSTQQVDIFFGEAGNDAFPIPLGTDVFFGGADNDLFLFDSATAAGAYLHGNEGTDTLSLFGTESQLLDLVSNSTLAPDQQFHLQGIEKIDMTSGDNQLRLNISDVLKISDTDVLTIIGDVADRVNSVGQGWILQGLDSSGLYNRYTANGAELLVDTHIANQFIS